jgi:hypothetical protein
VYSNGQAEVILGKAIKEIGMNRDEIVVMTCVRPLSPHSFPAHVLSAPQQGIPHWTRTSSGRVADAVCRQCFYCLSDDEKEPALWHLQADEIDKKGYVNRHGLSRKARASSPSPWASSQPR